MPDPASRDIVSVLNEALHVNVNSGAEDGNNGDTDATRVIIVKYLASAEGVERKLTEYLNEISEKHSLSGFSSLDFVSDAPSSSLQAILQPKSTKDEDIYVQMLSSLQELVAPGKSLLVHLWEKDVPRSHEKRERNAEKTPMSSQNEADFDPELNSDDATVSYDAMVVENLGQVLESSSDIQTLQTILSVFSLFGKIDAVFVPLKSASGPSIALNSVAYFGFARSKNTSKNLLRCMHHIHGLTLQQLLNFSEQDIVEDFMTENDDTPDSLGPDNPPTSKVSVCQKKHSHLLFDPIFSSFASFSDTKTEIQVYDSKKDVELFRNQIVPRFSKQLNFQEANIYVNNLPYLFENDDDKWHAFWSQFGPDGIKSAKIIKPQFYNKKAESSSGKFGFVFYKDLRMALRAILATNNRVIIYNGQNVRIQTSFAIQKRHGSGSKGSFGSDSESVYSRVNLGKHSEKYLESYPNIRQRFSSPAILDGNFIPGVMPPMMHPHPGLQIPAISGSGICSPLTPIKDGIFVNPYYYSVPASTMNFATAQNEHFSENKPEKDGQMRRFSEGPPGPVLMGGPPPYGFFYAPYSGPYNGPYPPAVSESERIYRNV